MTLPQVDDCLENVVFSETKSNEKQNYSSDLKFVIGIYFAKYFPNLGMGRTLFKVLQISCQVRNFLVCCNVSPFCMGSQDISF